MINRLKEKAKESNINIMYAALPDETYSGYIEKNGYKIILINEDIKGTDVERESIAQGLGYKMALDELGLKVNMFNKDHKDKAELVKDLATKHKDDILAEAALAELHELTKDMTQMELKELAKQVADEMVRQREAGGIYDK